MSDIAVSPVTPVAPLEAEMPKEAPSAPKPKPDRVRKKLDLTQNKRGAFSILVGTLSRAKQEDKERAASDSAQKRALLEKRLHAKLARETKSVQRAEQSKKDRISATRKEEELAMKENLIRHRHRHLPNLAKFLLSTDQSTTDRSSLSTSELLASLQPPRRAPPHPNVLPKSTPDSAIFYLPAKLLPWQEELLNKRAALVNDGVLVEWNEWIEERKKGLNEVEELKKRAEELGKELQPGDEEMDVSGDQPVSGPASTGIKEDTNPTEDSGSKEKSEAATKATTAGDEAVEY